MYFKINEFLKTRPGYDIGLSIIKRTLRRNARRRRRPLLGVRCSKKKLSDATEKDIAGRSNDVGYHCTHRMLISSRKIC